ncbi:MAG: peptide/nickel transport system ATP-binding protein [Paraglaciecola psychrophila]|jgi:peptide/nickel transport system ATP-binding protein
MVIPNTESSSLTSPLVSVSGLKTSFFTQLGEVKAVDDVSFSIDRGKTLGIVGESGCGKSVTSYAMMQLLEPPGRVVGGSALVDGVDVLALGQRQMQGFRGRRMAMIFQEPMTALNPVYTIGYQLDEQIKLHLGLSGAESRERAIEYLQLVGIPAPAQRYRDYPHQLSGGMRQRAMIAMALCCEPDFLIADEPTTALDVTIQAQILELIQDMQQRFSMTVQFITHDLGVISELADQVMVMYAGRTVEIAPADRLFAHPQHPYTQALINSLPRLGQRVQRLHTIEGSVPSPLDLPVGCAFQNRCARVSPGCAEKPPLRTIGDQHQVACFNV